MLMKVCPRRVGALQRERAWPRLDEIDLISGRDLGQRLMLVLIWMVSKLDSTGLEVS